MNKLKKKLDLSALIVTEICIPLNVLSTFISYNSTCCSYTALFMWCLLICMHCHRVVVWRVVELTTMWIQKYAKRVVIKQLGAVILLTPIHLQEASGAPALTLHQGGWITVHKRRFFLKERLSAVYIALRIVCTAHACNSIHCTHRKLIMHILISTSIGRKLNIVSCYCNWLGQIRRDWSREVYKLQTCDQKQYIANWKL